MISETLVRDVASSTVAALVTFDDEHASRAFVNEVAAEVWESLKYSSASGGDDLARAVGRSIADAIKRAGGEPLLVGSEARDLYWPADTGPADARAAFVYATAPTKARVV